MGGGGVLPIRQATYYEIGVGYGASLIGLSLAGVGRLIGTDVNRSLNYWELDLILDRYQKYAAKLGLVFPAGLGRPNANTNLANFLRDNFRIDYCAPYSAMQTDLPSDSVDYMSSIATFEHIPSSELSAVIKEQYRLLKPGGVYYCNIDYRDHCIYHKQKNKNYLRNRYGYLGYSPVEWDGNSGWKKSDCVYQNRLRTKDYVALFTVVGFRVLEIIPHKASDHIRLRELAKVKVDPCFTHYTTDELLAEGCTFILTKD